MQVFWTLRLSGSGPDPKKSLLQNVFPSRVLGQRVIWVVFDIGKVIKLLAPKDQDERKSDDITLLIRYTCQ